MYDYSLLCQKYDEILWWFMDWDFQDIVQRYIDGPDALDIMRQHLDNLVKYMKWYQRASIDDLEYRRNQYFNVLIVQNIYKYYELYEDFYTFIDDIYKKEQQRLSDIELLKAFGLVCEKI
jgi:hypothetical protein